jgi:nucleotide sugar dehydrogenase
LAARFDLAVVGIGNMGVSVLGAFLAKGRRCLAVDIDAQKVAHIAQGRSVVPEEGADTIFGEAVTSGRLAATIDVSRVSEGACAFVGVQTPANGDRCDYSALRRVLRELSECARRNQALVVGSTVFPGGIREHLVPELGARPDLHLVYEPVFLRAGHGIDDYLRPGKFIFGLKDPREVPEAIPATFGSVVEAEPLYVTWEEAEWAKMVHNAWMGVKVTFANELDVLCRSYGADTERVLRLALEENARGRLMTLSHMMPGPPYSGPCLPKDAAVLGGILAKRAAPWMQAGSILDALRRSNEQFTGFLVREWFRLGRAAGKPLGVVGTSFRPGFNEMRCSVALPFIRRAREEGLPVLAYDPAFEGIGLEDYLLACRGDKELEELHETVCRPLEEVWQRCGVVLLNRTLDAAERHRIDGLRPPRTLDLYQNDLRP